MFERIYDLLKDNLKNPKLYISILILAFLFLLLFPYLDANIFYFNRVNSRITILDNISKLEMGEIEKSSVLKEEYNSILQEIGKQKNGSLGNIFITNSSSQTNTLKFVSGGFLFWIMAIACFFIKTFKNFGQRMLGFFMLGIIGAVFAFVAKAIPIIISPFVNYIGFPLLILIAAILLMLKSQAKLKNK